MSFIPMYAQIIKSTGNDCLEDGSMDHCNERSETQEGFFCLGATCKT